MIVFILICNLNDKAIKYYLFVEALHAIWFNYNVKVSLFECGKGHEFTTERALNFSSFDRSRSDGVRRFRTCTIEQRCQYDGRAAFKRYLCNTRSVLSARNMRPQNQREHMRHAHSVVFTNIMIYCGALTPYRRFVSQEIAGCLPVKLLLNIIVTRHR